jgi:inorganic pyrophosphatase
MAYKDLTPGRNPPDDINVIIECPRDSKIKREFDKATEFMMIDREEASSLMPYPGNYGFIPHTLSEDGDPLDIIVWGQPPLLPYDTMRVRPVAVLIMEDEHGLDEKIIVVPVDSVSSDYTAIKDKDDIPKKGRKDIQYFFEHYKDLADQGKWSKVHSWGDAAEARRIIMESIDRAKHPGMAYGPLGGGPKPGP